MKRNVVVLSSATLLSAAIGLGVAIGETPQAKETKPAQAAAKSKEEPVKADRSTSDRDDKKASSQKTTDEDAIRETADSYAKAYREKDAKGAASHFTSDAEYVDEHGNVYEGRKAIEELLTECFKRNPEPDIEIDIGAIRFISAGVAVEDGSLTVLNENGETTDAQYTAIHVKTDGKWQVASVREKSPKDRRQHRQQLNQLSWLQGEWIDEDRDSAAYFVCAPIDNGNFLLREFAVVMDGQHVIGGSQRIGWDPLTGKLRTWIFDSEGGYGEGFWIRDDDRWLLKAVGVTSDGQMASSTTIYKKINDHTMTWQSVDHEVGGVRLPDSDVVTIVRRAAPPTSFDSESDMKAKTDPESKVKPPTESKEKSK